MGFTYLLYGCILIRETPFLGPTSYLCGHSWLVLHFEHFHFFPLGFGHKNTCTYSLGLENSLVSFINTDRFGKYILHLSLKYTFIKLLIVVPLGLKIPNLNGISSAKSADKRVHFTRKCLRSFYSQSMTSIEEPKYD